MRAALVLTQSRQSRLTRGHGVSRRALVDAPPRRTPLFEFRNRKLREIDHPASVRQTMRSGAKACSPVTDFLKAVWSEAGAKPHECLALSELPATPACTFPERLRRGLPGGDLTRGAHERRVRSGTRAFRVSEHRFRATRPLPGVGPAPGPARPAKGMAAVAASASSFKSSRATLSLWRNVRTCSRIAALEDSLPSVGGLSDEVGAPVRSEMRAGRSGLSFDVMGESWPGRRCSAPRGI
jgi:hypothetical protein